METETRNPGVTDSVISKDGTRIGFRQVGEGPGVVLIQGTMGSAENFRQLAADLAETFTVYVPDRRGRGLSPRPFSTDYRVERDVEDLESLLARTGARCVFGLSSGALIGLKAALTLPAIQKLAIFEPPLFVNGLPTTLIRRFQKEMDLGNVPAALVAAMKAAQLGPGLFNVIPNRILEPLTRMMLAQEEKKGTGPYPSMRELAPTLEYDFRVVEEMDGTLPRFRAIQAEVLLLGGSKSPAYLTRALDALEMVLPHVRRVELAGLDHSAAWNKDRRGRPERVAEELRKFFAADVKTT